MNGVLITLEGIEGSGKSTQARLLADALRAQGHEVLALREPGGSAIAEKIRALLLDPANKAMSSTAELLLYEAARAQLVTEILKPALDRGVIVVCDRFYDSTTAYQGAGRQLRSVDFSTLNRLATGGVVPDVTFLLDVPVEIGLRRAKGDSAGDRIEQEPLDFHHRVRQGFLAIAAAERARIHLLDGERPPAEVAAEIAKLAAEAVEFRRRSGAR
jgi:dTMP kinase